MNDFVETFKLANSALNDAILKLETVLKAKVACLQILEQQLAAMETERANKVANVGEQSEEHIFSQDPVKMALEVPLILETILGKLDFNSLMSSRAVSKYWNEAALTLFSKPETKGEPLRILKLEKLFESSDFSTFPELEPKLSKRIYFRGDCTCENPLYVLSPCNLSKQKLLMFCEKFSAQIEDLDFHMSESLVPTFLKAITNRCPNLEFLYLQYYYYRNLPNSRAQEAELIEMESMVQEEVFRMNLKTIAICEHANEYNQLKSFSGPLQRIIERAPNLAQLILRTHFYPNLTNNKNLKYLWFEGRLNEPNFSQIKLCEMLCQVKDSLEVLKIKTKFTGGTVPGGFRLIFPPHMKILKKLIIWNIFLYPLEKDGRTIIETIASQFPNLEHLEIRGPEGNYVEVLLNRAIQGPLNRLFKMQTLIVDRIQNSEVLAFFPLWFPNLKKLKFAISEDDEIGAVFSALKGLKLNHFSFTMEFCFNFFDLVTALVANQELFKGLDILEICADNIERPPFVDDLQFETRQLFCEWLRSTKGNIKSVTFRDFSFSGVTALEVMPLIRDHQLPVHFINNQS